jgi:thiosulfate reductase cytochrome b subunit
MMVVVVILPLIIFSGLAIDEGGGVVILPLIFSATGYR